MGSDRRDLGGASSHHPDAAAGQPGDLGIDHPSTTHRSRWRSCWVSPASVAGLGTNWFTGPKVQGTPEELAAIERELEVV